MKIQAELCRQNFESNPGSSSEFDCGMSLNVIAAVNVLWFPADLQRVRTSNILGAPNKLLNTLEVQPR